MTLALDFLESLYDQENEEDSTNTNITVSLPHPPEASTMNVESKLATKTLTKTNDQNMAIKVVTDSLKSTANVEN